MSDPRVFFAAERTLLAWIRTGLNIMAFGFVVARFGLFLRLITLQHIEVGSNLSPPSYFSNFVGIGLVLVGVASMFIATLQHRQFVASLPPEDVPQPNKEKDRGMPHTTILPVA